MSQENVEIIRRDYKAFDRGDFASFLDDLHPEIVTWAHPRGEAGRYEGKDGAIRFITDWTESFDEFSAVVEELRDAGDKVLVRARHQGQGKGSGIPVEAHYWLVHHMRDGKQYKVDLYDNEAEALEAAGLRE